jgi:hypothetical protein
MASGDSKKKRSPSRYVTHSASGSLDMTKRIQAGVQVK